jgi:hypothetical protein
MDLIKARRIFVDKLDSHDQLETMVVKPKITHNVVITTHSQHMQNNPTCKDE